jgi:tetratricopeptide (TPR) repeat protein
MRVSVKEKTERMFAKRSNWLVVLLVLLPGGRLAAEERVQDFLAALREEGFYDTALLYLDSLPDNPLTPDSFRELIPYERGITLIQAAGAERDMAAVEAKLTAARVSLDTFLRTNPDHPKADRARFQFGTLLMKWAEIKVEKAQKNNDPTLKAEAAELYDQARGIFEKAREAARSELAEIPQEINRVEQPEQYERRQELRLEYLDAWLSVAESWELKADTVPADAAERTKYLEQAAEQYGELYDNHSAWLIGLTARMYQGRVQMKLGNYDQALTYFTEDLLNLKDQPQTVRNLKLKTMLLAMDCWFRPPNPSYADAIARGTQLLSGRLPGEETDPDWLELQIKVAQAHAKFAEQLEEQDPNDRLIRDSLAAAKELAREVARAPSEYREAARELLVDLPGGMRAVSQTSEVEIGTFDEALNAGLEAISDAKTAEFLLESVQERLNKETNPEYRKEFAAEAAGARENIAISNQKAREMFELALDLANAETPLDELNQVRYSLAYIYFTQGDYYESAALAEFVGRRNPESTWAQKAAQLTLASFWKLYEATAANRDFASSHIVSIANYIVDTWPDAPEAADAINALIPFLIQKGELEKAKQYVDSIAEDSPQRGAAELRVGRAMWQSYVTGREEVAEWEAALDGASDAEATTLKQRIAARKAELSQAQDMAISILKSGADRIRRTKKMDSSVVLALLTLANIYVESDQANQAIQLLEDPDIGVLPLVSSGDPAVADARLVEETYRVTLSALVGALPSASDVSTRSELIDRIRQTMQDLKSAVGDSPGSERRLVGIFMQLASGLERQIRLLDRIEDRRLLSKGFESFLDQVRAESKDFGVLNWVAQSYSSLGEGLRGNKAVAALARSFFQKSVETYDQILSQARRDKASQSVIRQLQINQATALRQAGKYKEAIALFTELLSEKQNVLSLQMEAAKTYQQWAEIPGQAGRYLNATRGGQKDDRGKMTIWGWGRLAQVTARYEQYRSTFYEARFNLALCKYKLARRRKDVSKRTKDLQDARRDIELTQRMFAGGMEATWRSKFDALLKEINRELKP